MIDEGLNDLSHELCLYARRWRPYQGVRHEAEVFHKRIYRDDEPGRHVESGAHHRAEVGGLTAYLLGVEQGNLV